MAYAMVPQGAYRNPHGLEYRVLPGPALFGILAALEEKTEKYLGRPNRRTRPSSTSSSADCGFPEPGTKRIATDIHAGELPTRQAPIRDIAGLGCLLTPSTCRVR